MGEKEVRTSMDGKMTVDTGFSPARHGGGTRSARRPACSAAGGTRTRLGCTNFAFYAVRRPLKSRNFITALYRRDTRIPSCAGPLLFFATRKPVCYIRRGDIAFSQQALELAAQNCKFEQYLFKTKAKGVKQ